jgi:DNA-binding transcriptional MocR family regulator
MQSIRRRIERRSLTPGARLPSVRAMADTSGFSKSTVVEAYERLAAEGVIRSRPGAGFFVAAPLAPLALAQIGPPVDEQVDPLWMLRQSLLSHPDALKPGCGWLPDDWLPQEVLRRSLRALARPGERAQFTGYGSPAGSEPLRRLMARRMLDQGIEAGPDQVLLTDSGTHAIDIVLRFLIEPGQTVLVDDPCYFNFHALLRAHRAKVVGVPLTPQGPDLEALAVILAEHRPRLYLTNSAYHNPTGLTVSAATVHRILALAEAHDMVVVEDDIFADFEAEPSPRFAAFDGLNRVIRVDSHSKSLSSAVRCGHIAARRDWISAMTDLRIATGMSGSLLTTDLVYGALTDPGYRRHMDKLRTRLAKAMDQTLRRLAPLGIVPWIKPGGGQFIWCALPHGIDAAQVARLGLAEGIVFAPGDAFSLSRRAHSHMRFNVSRMDDDRIYECLARAIETLRPTGGLAPD